MHTSEADEIQELLEVYLSVAVLVGFVDKVVDVFLREPLADLAHRSLELLPRDTAAAVRVPLLEDLQDLRLVALGAALDRIAHRPGQIAILVISSLWLVLILAFVQNDELWIDS